MTTLTKFADCKTDPVVKDVSATVISGSPEQKVWPHFTGDNGKFISGIWESTSGVFHGPMNDQIEYCHILEGEATIKLGDGTEYTVSAGDGFVMDNGLQPVWHVGKYVKKQYVIVFIPA